MRTQKFRCQRHGEFEVDLEYGQDAPIWCPIYKDGTKVPCGEKLTKLFRDVPNIQFRGSGFYVNDKEK